MSPDTQRLIDKIQTLPPNRLAEVDDFVEFLQYKEHERILTQAATQLSAPALAAVWANAEDEVYDAL
jgi:hypothetical protein